MSLYLVEARVDVSTPEKRAKIREAMEQAIKAGGTDDARIVACRSPAKALGCFRSFMWKTPPTTPFILERTERTAIMMNNEIKAQHASPGLYEQTVEQQQLALLESPIMSAQPSPRLAH